jgi:CDP-6-deoxy-D-xylo-4-hexulose-3-dehydrase
MTNQNNFIRVPYGSTVHGQEEINAVVEVLNTTTQMSKNVSEFESKVANLFDKKFGVMVNSGTSALYLSVEAMALPRGSEVITPALTFATTVGCLVKNELIPAFVDVKENTYCVDEEKIEEKINDNTSAICIPDLMGNLCNWKKIREIADKYGLKILHDSADTIGAELNGVPVGRYSDISITSFYGSHVINGAGNGGMICTNNKDWAEKMKLLRSWGRSSSLFVESEAIENRFNVELEGITYDAKFVFEEIGYQLEPSEISAAFALVQLKNLPKNIKSRQDNFASHNKFFSKYSDAFTLPQETEGAYTCWLAYPMLVSESATFSRTDLQIFLEKRNIQTRVVFTGNILRQPGFKNINCIGKADEFVNADRVMKQGILLACHHGLNKEMINHLYDSIDLFMSSH